AGVQWEPTDSMQQPRHQFDFNNILRVQSFDERQRKRANSLSQQQQPPIPSQSMTLVDRLTLV
ncbi:hypothetical protein TorRG33x02_329430, partial [Trema orientale]